MNCQNAQNSLSAYLDRELPGDQMIAVRAHVEICASCEAELGSLRALKTDLASLPLVEPREGFADDVMRLVRNEKPEPVRVPVFAMVATSVAAAALAVLLFNAFIGGTDRTHLADDGARFDEASDAAVTNPDFGSHAPLIPVGR